MIFFCTQIRLKYDLGGGVGHDNGSNSFEAVQIDCYVGARQPDYYETSMSYADDFPLQGTFIDNNCGMYFNSDITRLS